MKTLSLAMIVKNEVATLGHCLSSVKGLVDQVVVVDTGSMDGTQDLAKGLGAEVHSFPWCNDFAAARNASLAQCRCEWVLVLDADEALDPEAFDPIRAVMAEDRGSAFLLTLRNYYLTGGQTLAGLPARPNLSDSPMGRGLPFLVDFRGLRLCRRLPDLAFEGRIHELLNPFFERQGLPILPLDAVIHHYGKTFGDREEHKRTYYLELARDAAQREPDNFQFQFNLLQQALNAQAWEEALQTAQRCMGMRPVLPILVLLGAAVAHQELGRPKEALPLLEAVLRVEPWNPAALVRKGVSLAHTGDTKGARAQFRRALEATPDFLLAYLNLAELERGLENFGAAFAALREGLQRAPGDAKIREALVRSHLEVQDFQGASHEALEALEACPAGGGGLWHRLGALGLVRAGKNSEAQDLLEEGMKRFPADPELPRLRSRL